MDYLKFMVAVVFLATVCHSQDVAVAEVENNNVVCRRCSPQCVQVQRFDGGCPGCICGGLLLSDCPNVDCPSETDPSCRLQRTADGCVECICIEQVHQNPINIPVLPEAVSNGGMVCPSLPPCPQHCQQIDPTGCPICDCSDENNILYEPLPDAVNLCHPLPLCPVGCIETELRGEFDCYECNCTLPELDPTSVQSIGDLDPLGLLPQSRPRISPSDFTGGLLPSEISPLNTVPVCGETECPNGCNLCIGRDGCGRCLCGQDSVICPAFPSCPASCISQLRNGCLHCACSPESLNPRLQSVIIDRIPANLQPEFVSDLPPIISPFRSQQPFSYDGFGNPFRVGMRPQQFSPAIISRVIDQFTPDFIFSLPNLVKYQLATQLLSFIRPEFRSQLSPEFVSQTPPESLFRGPRPLNPNSLALSPGRTPSFGSPLGNQFPPQSPINPSRIPSVRPGTFPHVNPEHPLASPDLGETFGFGVAARRRRPINNLNYVPSSVLRHQGGRESFPNNVRNGRVPPHFQREEVTKPAVNTGTAQNEPRTNVANPQLASTINNRVNLPTNTNFDGTREQLSNPRASTAAQDFQTRVEEARNQGRGFTGEAKAPLKRLQVQGIYFGRILDPFLYGLNEQF